MRDAEIRLRQRKWLAEFVRVVVLSGYIDEPRIDGAGWPVRD